MIRKLEQDRVENEVIIAALKKKSADTEHDLEKTNILIEKQKNEIEYINLEQDKLSCQNYSTKVDQFKKYIAESQVKT